MKWGPRGLRAQLTWCVAAVVLAVVALSGVVIALRSSHTDLEQVDGQLASRLGKVSTDADKLADGDDRGDSALLAGSQTLTRVLGADGSLIAQKGEIPQGSDDIPAEQGFSTVDLGGQDWRSYVAASSDGGRVQVLQSLAPLEDRREDNVRLIAAVTAVATLGASALVWLGAGLVLQPLERLRRGATDVRRIDAVGHRLPDVRRPQEIAELSSTLNEMLGRLEASTQSMRRFTADAGHELRTPLTSVGLGIDTLRRGSHLPDATREQVVSSLAVEHRRMVSLLEGLQQLARGDAGALPTRGSVDVIDLVQSEIERARRRHLDVTFVFETDESVDGRTSGWENGLRVALTNLLDNAALHGNPGALVEVQVRSSTDDIVVEVSDDGPGIPASERDRLRERFARGSQTTAPGSGLGLALVDQQAALHGGSLELETSRLGGLLARLVLRRDDTATATATGA